MEQQFDDGWTKYVIRFINKDWPRERQYRTLKSMGAWIGLLENSGDSFPTVYGAVKNLLVPVDSRNHPFYRFTLEMNDEKCLTTRFCRVSGQTRPLLTDVIDI